MITTGWITRLTVAARLVQISYPGVSSSLRTCTLEGTEHVGAMSDRGAIIQLRWGALVDVWKRKDVVLELFLNFFRGSLFTFKKIKHLGIWNKGTCPQHGWTHSGRYLPWTRLTTPGELSTQRLLVPTLFWRLCITPCKKIVGFKI